MPPILEAAGAGAANPYALWKNLGRPVTSGTLDEDYASLNDRELIARLDKM